MERTNEIVPGDPEVTWGIGLEVILQVQGKGRVPTRSFDGSADVGLPTSQVSYLFCRVRCPAFLGL